MPTINSINTINFSLNKNGELKDAYSPLLNLIDSKNQLGDFRTSNLNFDRYTPVDILVVDEYDGSENLIINDDKNNPKLINSRFSVLENHTFEIPVHNGNAVTNVYEDLTFGKDTQLLKLYDKIPVLTFKGISEGGEFKCGSYVFYFKLSDADGNLTNIVQESSIVQIHMGVPNSKKVRMGMEDENAKKCVLFTLSGIDKGFDYVSVFYERTSTDSSQAIVKTYYMITDRYPIRNQKCNILLTGGENILQIDKSDIRNEFADIATCKTQAVVDNTLFLGNISAYELEFSTLQQIAWKIIPSVKYETKLGSVSTENYSLSGGAGYYNVNNVYNYTGYWDDEFYRFAIIFIYNNNLLSPAFNLQGGDFNQDLLVTDFFGNNLEAWENEPDDFFFNETKRLNSKGVIRFPEQAPLNAEKSSLLTPKVTSISFDMSYITKKSYTKNGSEIEFHSITDEDISPYEYLKNLGIKGFFFVRQKRIPTIIALGMVIDLTGKDNGCIPVLENINGFPITKSFLSKDRLILEHGSTVIVKTPVTHQALLVPDYEINNATLNLIFTGLEFLLTRCISVENNIIDNHHFTSEINIPNTSNVCSNVKLTAVPKETKILTDGENYFSTRAGVPDEPYKTADVNNVWNSTPPQNLTASTSLIRGNWGSFVGMSANTFSYGDIVNIKPNTFKDQDHDILEYQKRFADYSLFSAISPRYNLTQILGAAHSVTCYRGDCFKNAFTHRMMTNFIDPELPTNTLIINPGCWAENYGVRCTAEILSSTHSNLTEDSDGWYIPSPLTTKKSKLVTLIFGILTANVGTIINAISDSSTSQVSSQDTYANEIAQAFEVYTGKSGSETGETYSTFSNDDDTKLYTTQSGLLKFVEKGWIKKVDPKEQEKLGGLNLKALFKSDDKWELHGLASINRADINAVSFGQWITFPICSRYNLAFRDVDFSNATEEAAMNKKRSFYPLEDMDVTNHLLESEKINGAAKVSISDNSHTAYTTVPFIKLEYFNRIYWSKPNVAESFINSYRIIFQDQFKEYNKEFGAITKIENLGNSLLVVFQHGIGLLPINRTPQNEKEQSPYLSSRSVLPTLVLTLTSDYGSMWKDSILKSPYTLIIYGVDTVAKKIWAIGPGGSKLEFLSDFKMLKFLNDWIDLSEYNFNEYQGHINVKTHYNEFKHDVIFTYYHDIPMTIHTYMENPKTGKLEIKLIGTTWDSVNEQWVEPEITPEYQKVDLSGNLILEETVDPKPLIDKWETGKTWSLCYNERTGNFVTFYDWYPVESCNVDNIWFSFDKDVLDDIYENTSANIELCTPTTFINIGAINKYFIDKAFSTTCLLYSTSLSSTSSGTETETFKTTTQYPTYFSFYYKIADGYEIKAYDSLTSEELTIHLVSGLGYDKDANWVFAYCVLDGTTTSIDIVIPSGGLATCAEFKFSYYNFTNTEWTKDPDACIYALRNNEENIQYLWKHGQAGLYDNEGKILPTKWYGKQHEFNFEFVVNELPSILKIFNNLKIISNKTAPNKFEYEVVGESYDWFYLKPVIQWINDTARAESTLTAEQLKFNELYLKVLTKSQKELITTYPTYPAIFDDEDKIIKKIPYLHFETCDKSHRLDKSYHQYDKTTNEGVPDYWDLLSPNRTYNYRYAYNTSEPIIVEDELLSEQRVHTESLGQDIRKQGRLKGNMQYLEDLWDIEIRPIKFNWAYVKTLEDEELSFIPSKEARHRDKYIKIKVRYSGEDLAVVQGVLTMFDYSYA